LDCASRRLNTAAVPGIEMHELVLLSIATMPMLPRPRQTVCTEYVLQRRATSINDLSTVIIGASSG
jgi:hypothetical protein